MNIRILIIIFCLLSISCSKYPIQRIGKVHDYEINGAKKSCENHGGLHYIVDIETLSKETTGTMDFNDYPCSDRLKFRCQDDTLINFDTGIGYCFISEIQLQETLEENK